MHIEKSQQVLRCQIARACRLSSVLAATVHSFISLAILGVSSDTSAAVFSLQLNASAPVPNYEILVEVIQYFFLLLSTSFSRCS